MKILNCSIIFHYPEKKYSEERNPDGSVVMVKNVHNKKDSKGVIHPMIPKKNISDWGRRVECLIYDEDKQLIAKGTSSCFSGFLLDEDDNEYYSEDKFSKEIGRKKALANALETANWNKEERALVWETYRKTKPSGRWTLKSEKTEVAVNSEEMALAS